MIVQVVIYILYIFFYIVGGKVHVECPQNCRKVTSEIDVGVQTPKYTYILRKGGKRRKFDYVIQPNVTCQQ